MKEMLKRAFRTFIQAALGYIAANIIYIVSSSPENFDYMKNTVMGLLISASAAGLSAVMNAPRKAKEKAENKNSDKASETEDIYSTEKATDKVVEADYEIEDGDLFDKYKAQLYENEKADSSKK